MLVFPPSLSKFDFSRFPTLDSPLITAVTTNDNPPSSIFGVRSVHSESSTRDSTQPSEHTLSPLPAFSPKSTASMSAPTPLTTIHSPCPLFAPLSP